MNWSLLLITLFCVAKGTSSGDLNHKQNLLLQHAMKSLLGFKDLPATNTAGKLATPLNENIAPRFMFQLYERFKQGRLEHGKRRKANTIRSIHAEMGLVNGENMFIFNLSSITTSEKVFAGEIHLYKKKLKSRSEGTDILMKLFELAPNFLMDLGTRKLPTRSYGWQAAEITKELKNCLTKRQKLPHLLALSFVLSKDDGHLTALNMSQFGRSLSRPFLVVYSRDAQNISLDHIDPHFASKDMKGVYVNPENGQRETYGRNQRRKRSEKSAWSRSGENVETSVADGSSDFRDKRSIYDNEIPETSIELKKASKFPRTNPDILMSRLHPGKSKVTPLVHIHREPTVPEDSSDIQSRLIPYPEDYKRKRRKNKHRKNRKRQKVSLLAHSGGRGKSRHIENDLTAKKETLCSKRTLTVDFADIGWSEWIISPSSFHAHYCAGVCPFPLTQRMRPSNHATIQSLVHAVGIHTDVPSPCCVPDSMSSVSLLYFDESKNVVLKNYPGMTVRSCACR